MIRLIRNETLSRMNNRLFYNTRLPCWGLCVGVRRCFRERYQKWSRYQRAVIHTWKQDSAEEADKAVYLCSVGNGNVCWTRWVRMDQSASISLFVNVCLCFAFFSILVYVVHIECQAWVFAVFLICSIIIYFTHIHTECEVNKIKVNKVNNK